MSADRLPKSNQRLGDDVVFHDLEIAYGTMLSVIYLLA